MRKIRSLFYFMFAIILLIYGLPRFKLVGIESMSDGFAIIWSAFALIIIGAHLFELLGVTREREIKAREPVRQFKSF